MADLKDLLVESGSLEEWARRALWAEARVEKLLRERDAVNERHAHAVERLSELRNEIADRDSLEVLICRARGSSDPVVAALTGQQIEAVVRAAVAAASEGVQADEG
jgi:hypothetical protein